MIFKNKSPYWQYRGSRKWHFKFAWKPIRINETTVVWLSWIVRKNIADEVNQHMAGCERPYPYTWVEVPIGLKGRLLYGKLGKYLSKFLIRKVNVVIGKKVGKWK